MQNTNKTCSKCRRSEPDVKFWKHAKLVCAECSAGQKRAWRMSNGAKPRDTKNRSQMQGMVFGELTGVEMVGRTASGDAVWKCRCSCGELTNVVASALLSGNTKSCGCLRRRTRENSPFWSGHEGISGLHWNVIRSHAKARRREFAITKLYAWELYESQNRLCALSGLPITFPDSAREKGTASLDRIDGTKGYIEGNVQWVHKDINMMKRVFDDDYFIEMCKAVARHNE